MRRFLFALVVIAACGKNQSPPPPSGGPVGAPETGPSHHTGEPVASGQTRAEKMYGMFCTLCHGADGTGNGTNAANLAVKPRNYTDPKWQASVTDDDIKKIILHGGPAVGKSELMSGHPELDKDPEVLDGLVKIIRGFGKAP
jgi:cytochrome c553